MNVRKRAESSTPAMPSTRSRGNPDASQRDVAHRVERVGDDDQDRVRRVAHRLLDDGPDDPGVLGEQIVAAHARLAGQAGRDDDDIGAGGVRVVVRSDHARVVPDDGGGLGKVEALALRQPLDDVDEDDVGDARLRDALGGRRADVAGADDRDLVAGHDFKTPRAAGFGRSNSRTARRSWRRRALGVRAACRTRAGAHEPGSRDAARAPGATPDAQSSMRGPAARTSSPTPSA